MVEIGERDEAHQNLVSLDFVEIGSQTSTFEATLSLLRPSELGLIDPDRESEVRSTLQVVPRNQRFKISPIGHDSTPRFVNFLIPG